MLFIPITYRIAEAYVEVCGIGKESLFPYPRWDGFDLVSCIITYENNLDLAVVTQKGNVIVKWLHGYRPRPEFVHGNGKYVSDFLPCERHDRVMAPQGIVEVGWQGLDKWIKRDHERWRNDMTATLLLQAFCAGTKQECEGWLDNLGKMEISCSVRPWPMKDGHIGFYDPIWEQRAPFSDIVDEVIHQMYYK